MHQLVAWLDRYTPLLLLISALVFDVAFFLSVLRAETFEGGLWSRTLVGLAALLITTLALFLLTSKIVDANRFKRLEDSLTGTMPLRWLTPRRVLWEDVQKLAETVPARTIVRATSMGRAAKDGPPQLWPDNVAYLQALAHRSAELAAAEHYLKYRVLLSNSFARAYVDERWPILHQAGMRSELFEPKSLDEVWSIDVLIINNTVIIGFPTWPHEPKLSAGLRIDNPEVASALSDWFDGLFEQGVIVPRPE